MIEKAIKMAENHQKTVENGEKMAKNSEKMNNPDFILKDSGERQTFDTGAVRDSEAGKGRFDLIPTQMLFRLAKHYERGAVKYDDRNWEKGMSISRCIDSAMRHLTKYVAGWNDEPHLDAAFCNLAADMFYEYEHPELMDLPDRKDLGIKEIQKWCKFKED